jgi:hypothetical protein
MFEPMKPAPPVTKTIGGSCLGLLSDAGDRGGRGVAVDDVGQFHLAAPGLHQVAADDFAFGVVRALDQNVGSGPPRSGRTGVSSSNGATRSTLLQPRQHQGAALQVVHRPVLALQARTEASEFTPTTSRSHQAFACAR